MNSKLSNISILIFVAYTLAGFILVFIGPFRKQLDNKIFAMKMLNSIHMQVIPSWKYRLLRLIASLSIVIFWPVFLISEFKHNQYSQKNKNATSSKLYFSRIGGAGILTCKDCGHAEKVISFIHGTDWSKSGYQCERCGAFASAEDEQSDIANFPCKCGGRLLRNATLFCPECRSFHLNYEMSIIT